MRCSSALVLAVSAVGCVFSGCVADHASPIDETESMPNLVIEAADEPADPNDPFGACKDPDPSDDWRFPKCSIEGIGCYGWGLTTGCTATECDAIHQWQVCSHHCEAASDCPVPATGDAVPACEVGRCMLPCDENTDCPDGFVCASATQIGAESHLHGWSCMQYIVVPPYSF